MAKARKKPVSLATRRKWRQIAMLRQVRADSLVIQALQQTNVHDSYHRYLQAEDRRWLAALGVPANALRP